MKTKLKMSVACGLAALLVSFGAQAEEEKSFNIGGDLEYDITSQTSDKLSNGGRVKLNAVGELKGDGYFVKGVAQPLFGFNATETVGYDDVFLQFGQDAWDVQIGAFEGYDVFPVGKDTVAIHAGGVPVYGGNMLRGRHRDALHTALHLKASDAVKFELGVVLDNDKVDGVTVKRTGLRPAVIYSMGPATVRAAIESDDNDGVKNKGFGISGGFNMGAGSANLGYAKKSPATGDDVTSIAANYTQGPWGVGLINSKSGEAKVNTMFGAYTMPLLGSKAASVTVAASTSKASGSVDAKENAFRVRFNYGF